MAGWNRGQWSRTPWLDALLKRLVDIAMVLAVGFVALFGLAVWLRFDPPVAQFRAAAVGLMFVVGVRLLWLIALLVWQPLRAARTGHFVDEVALPRRSASTLPDAVAAQPVGSPPPLVLRAPASSVPFVGGDLDPRVAELMLALAFPQSVSDDGTVLHLGDAGGDEYSYHLTATANGLNLLWVGERRARRDIGTFATLDAFQKWWLVAHCSQIREALGVEPARVTVNTWGPGANAPGTEVEYGERSENLVVGGLQFAHFPRRYGNDGISAATVLSNVAGADLADVLAAIRATDGGAYFSEGHYTYVMSDRRLALPDPTVQVPDPRRGDSGLGADRLAELIASGLASRREALDFMASFLNAAVVLEFTPHASLWDTAGDERVQVVWLGEPRFRGWKWDAGTGADAVVACEGKGGLVIRHGTHALVLSQRFVAAYVERAGKRAR